MIAPVTSVVSTFAPNGQFNALPEHQKKQVLSGGLGAGLLSSGMEFAIPLWWLVADNDDAVALRNGSAFLVDLGQEIFAVTAAHVFREYCRAKKAPTKIGCQLGSLLFDPEARLVDCRDDLDIATLRITAEEVGQIGKRVATPGLPYWERLKPEVGNFAFFAGFPAQARGMTSDGNFSTAPYFAMPPITSVTDHQIACRFDREKSIDFTGSDLPPVGYDIGGVSGLSHANAYPGSGKCDRLRRLAVCRRGCAGGSRRTVRTSGCRPRRLYTPRWQDRLKLS